MRYRFYPRWGVTAEELTRIVFFYSVTFWLGLLLLGGLSLAASSLPRSLDIANRGLIAPAGWLLIASSLGYVAVAIVRRAPIRLRSLELSLPTPGLAVALLSVSAVDWALAGSVLYVLLPPSDLTFVGLLGAFLTAQLVGLASHVPGGVGVFEGVLLLLLKPFLMSGELLPALVVYRAVYYLLPLTAALVVLIADEIQQRRAQAARVTAVFGRLSEELMPRVLAAFTFLSGVVLLFSGATPAAAKLRQATRRLEKEGATFRVVAKDGVSGLLGQLRDVSDDWLRVKAAAEKGFSLGFFDAEYLSRFPAALIEQRGRVVAFANLWPGPRGLELSLDLMRYHHTAPKEVMEGLFVHVLQWGKAQGYQRISLGMAPLSGFERSPIAPFWNRLGSFLYEHGERLYNFQGLRAYKNKFGTDWEPRYLVYPGGLRLPRILADVAALIAGGYRGILTR